MNPAGETLPFIDPFAVYCRTRSASDFTLLVHHYLPLVYAAAVRQVHDPAMAEDVTQAVFILLVHKVPTLSAHTSIGGWLLKAARYCASDAVKREQRRIHHEQKAAAMRSEVAATDDSCWPELAPHLDAALTSLSAKDRSALVLRFFEGLTLEEVGGSLGLSKDGANKRIMRALEKLRHVFQRKGQALAIPALATALAAGMAKHAAAAPSPALTAKICGAALANSGASMPASLIAKGAAKLMAGSAAKVTAAAAALTLTLVSVSFVIASFGGHQVSPAHITIANSAASATAPAPAAVVIPHDPNPTIEVVDMATHQPLEGVQIELSGGFGIGSSPSVSGVTSASGAVLLALPATITDSLQIMARKEGYVPAGTSGDRIFPGDILPAKFSLQLEKAVTIGGRVVDDRGLPLESALVEVIVFKQYQGLHQNIPWNLRAITNARGAWSLNSAPPECESIRVGAYHATCASPGIIYEEVVSIADLRSQSAVITLKRGTPVPGVLHGPDGKPVKGWIGIGDQRIASNAVPEFPTSADGTFAVVPTPGEPLYIAAGAEGCASQLVEFKSTAPQPLIITLQPATPLQARLVDSEGHPISNAVATTDYIKRGGRYSRPAFRLFVSDADGRISWPENFQTTEFVNIFARGYLQQTDIPLTPGQPNEITMLHRFIVHASVVDDDAHQSAAKFRVAEGTLDSVNQQTMHYSDYPGWEGSHIRQTGSGTFDFTDNERQDRFVLCICGGDYEPADSQPIVADGRDQSVTIHVRKGTRVAGTLLDVTGRPLAKTQVHLAPIWLDVYDAEFPSPQPGIPDYDDSPYFSLTDANGKFSFSPQRGNFILMASNDTGYIIAKAKSFTNNAALQLIPWAKMEGTLLTHGKPAPNTKVNAEFDEPAFEDEIGPYCHFNTVTDKDGHFLFPIALVGSYGFNGSSPTSINGSPATDKTFKSQPGKTSTVILETVAAP